MGWVEEGNLLIITLYIAFLSLKSLWNFPFLAFAAFPKQTIARMQNFTDITYNWQSWSYVEVLDLSWFQFPLKIAIMNMSPDKLCLNWKNFQQNISSAFRELRSDNDFSDVTLACKDGFQLLAHKVILASSSPFFMNILKMNKNPHPLIYMRGWSLKIWWPL